jgi:hypothetical protein
MEFCLDGFDLPNTVNAPSYVGVSTSPLFGRTNSALAAAPDADFSANWDLIASRQPIAVW